IRPTDGTHSTGQALTGDCSGCHNTRDWTSNLMPAGHMPNPGNQTCATCHTAIGSTLASYATLAGISVLHTGISAGCNQCHGGTTPPPLTFYNNTDNPKAAILSPTPHIPFLSGTDCVACHTPNYVSGGFGPATAMSAAKHAYVPTTCNKCHNTGANFYVGGGTPLQTRPTSGIYNHIGTANPLQATADCSQCHNTSAWTAIVLPQGHMPNPSNLPCATCHTAGTNYAVLASISVLHTGITSGCAQCHGGSAALSFINNNDIPKAGALSPPHIPAFTSTDCSDCHAANYTLGGFSGTTMNAAKHAFVGSTCDNCHGVASAASFYPGAALNLQIRPTDGTHSTGQALTGDCSGCHNTTDWTSNSLPAGHMPNPGNQVCSTCHTAIGSTLASYATLASISVLHTGISSGCAQCHGDTTKTLTFYNNNDNPKSGVLAPVHIPILSGTDCTTCHGTNYVASGFSATAMSSAKHAFVTTACNTCHGVASAASFYPGAALNLQIRPTDATHSTGQALTGDCSGCHNTANWVSNTLPANHMPNPGNQACGTCHIAIPTYTTLAAKAVLHTGISSGCITCHGAPNVAAPIFANSFSPKAASSVAHIPSGATPCEDCHSNTTFTSFGGASMSSAKHTLMFGYVSATNCDACHEIGKSFYGVNNLTVRPDPGHHKGQDCSGSSCHNTNNWGGGSTKKKAAATASTRSTIGTVVSAPGTAQNSATAATGTTTRGIGTAGTSLLRRENDAATLRAASVGPGTRTAPLSHAGITGNCVGCHNGVLAAGKGATHIAANSSCENCHTTLAWLPARFEHRGVTASCASCHNGVSAPGKPARHVQSFQDCGACHGTISWSAATFSHLGITATCQSCHNGITATAKQVQHVSTTLDCGSCHNTLSWTVAAKAAPRLRPLIPVPGKNSTSRSGQHDSNSGQPQ
ncbi:MAG: hypothetical protein M3O41_12650, partial [Pseudomonadota bacterium]|nr:hypothetical protein [Pseudomonadota bacterium]